jgi:hypothetical protein
MQRCRDVIDLVGSGEWRAAPLRRRLALAMHLAMCRHCRAYTVSLRRIGDAARRLYRSERLDAERVERLIRKVRDAAQGPPKA